VALLGWIPISLLFFLCFSPHRAVIASVIGAWLLLPPAYIPIAGLPDYNKLIATTLGVILGTLIFQPDRLLRFRLRWFDLPILCWCICHMISSLENGLGLYDGLSALLLAVVRWVLPYLIGRLYFADLRSLGELAIGIAVGGLAYLPPTWFEIRMSPMLQKMVYGIGAWGGIRFYGYRPCVFLTNGLEHGMWMTIASLTAVWLWKCGVLTRIWAIPVGSVILPALLITTVLCRSTGAVLLLVAGLFGLWFCTRFRTKSLLYLLLLVAPVYYALRIPSVWTGENVVNFIDQNFSSERAQSLKFRFACEDMLCEKALQRPVWGWGGWGGNRVIGPDGRDQAPTDGMWIIYLGCYGYAGLLTWTTVMLLPSLLFLRRFSVRDWDTTDVGPLAAMATVVGLYTIDCLVNGFINLVVIVAAGGLISIRPAASTRNKLPWKSRYIAQPGGLVRASSGRRQLPRSTDMTTESSAGPISLDPLSSQTQEERLAARYQYLARTLKSQGQSAEARAAWTHAVELFNRLASTHPEDPGIQKQRWDCVNDLAWFLLSESDPAIGDPSLALHLAKQATDASAACAAYWNTLGAAYYLQGDAPTAIAALQQSIALSKGGTAFDFVFLTLAHIQLGQEEQARYWNDQTIHWMEEHDFNHPDLSRLCQQACRRLAARNDASTS
jgi:hypothetical protein